MKSVLRAIVTKGKHHRRCENVENDTCGAECYMVLVGTKILAVTPDVKQRDLEVAELLAAAINTPLRVQGLLQDD